MVVDTSALLAVLFAEPPAAWLAERMNEHARVLCMSTVNLTEALILARDRRPHTFPALERRILRGTIRFVAPSMTQARIAAHARLKYPLNLGDCFAYALAAEAGLPILATDPDFRRTDAEVVIPP